MRTGTAPTRMLPQIWQETENDCRVPRQRAPAMAMNTPERDLEESLVAKLRDFKYEYRPDIRDRATLEANFREKFEALNRVTLYGWRLRRTSPIDKATTSLSTPSA